MLILKFILFSLRASQVKYKAFIEPFSNFIAQLMNYFWKQNRKINEFERKRSMINGLIKYIVSIKDSTLEEFLAKKNKLEGITHWFGWCIGERILALWLGKFSSGIQCFQIIQLALVVAWTWIKNEPSVEFLNLS